MKFLVDNMLSQVVAESLRTAGYDAVHVRDYDMQNEKDSHIFDRAADEDRILISADTDFGQLLAMRNSEKPSVILLRLPMIRLPSGQVKIVLDNLPNLAADLEKGSVVVIEPSRIRVRKLPINASDE
jgi:predicted nuclease of predicted toxin-antitoxin system